MTIIRKHFRGQIGRLNMLSGLPFGFWFLIHSTLPNPPEAERWGPYEVVPWSFKLIVWFDWRYSGFEVNDCRTFRLFTTPVRFRPERVP